MMGLPRVSRLMPVVAALGLSGLGVNASAQSVARPVAQSIAATGGTALNAALARLGRNPRDVEALLDAGRAASGMNDFDAAVGFYQRADQLLPNNARVKAGLAGALVRSENPFDAIPLFAEAAKAGAADAAFAADRALAYDLVGDSKTAQGYYRLALAQAPSDEITRRYALSLAISGDKAGMATALSPLLLRQDKAAWRVRAFSLAILGAADEAESIVYATMPKDLAAGITPYLRYMPRLTPAQQAAAANFGHFPRAADIGRDDPRVAQYATTRPRAVLAGADAALVPAGKPLGATSRSRREARTAQPAAQAPRVAAAPPPPVPQPTREITTAPSTIPPAAAPPQVPVSSPAAVLATAQSASATAERVAAVAPDKPLATPGFTAIGTPDLGAAAGFKLAPTTAPPVAATAPPKRAAPPPRRPSIADAFGDFSAPSRDVGPAAGAVDVRRIRATRPAPDPKTVKPATPPPPSHPTRIWVQVATGRDKAALGFDWRRIVRAAPEALRGKSAFLSGWGQTNRLLTGPFVTQAAATAFLAQLRRADVDGAFAWTSPAGQVVDALGGK